MHVLHCVFLIFEFDSFSNSDTSCMKSVLELGEHSAIRLTFIKLPFVVKTFVLSILDKFYCNCENTWTLLGFWYLLHRR